MADIDFRFTLTEEEAEALGQHLHSYFRNGLMNITDSMVRNKDDQIALKAEILWFVKNMEWFCSIVKRVGFNTAFTEDSLKKTREIHHLTDGVADDQEDHN